MASLSRSALLYVVAATFAGCGGGGGSSAGSIGPMQAPLLVTVDVASAWHNFLNRPHSWIVSGNRTNGTAFQFDVNVTPGPLRIFDLLGQRALTTGQAFRLAFAGLDPVFGNTTMFFNNDSIIGISTANGGCGIARNGVPILPVAGGIGSGGQLFVLDNFALCRSQGAASVGITTTNWAIEADSGVALFCLSTRRTSATGLQLGTEVDCIEVDPRGELGTGARVTITLADGSVVSGRNF